LITWLADFRFDLRRGAKLLRKSSEFTLAAVLTLALGIRATTAIFSVLHSIVLRPLPFPDPEQLVWVAEVNQRDGCTRPPSIAILWVRTAGEAARAAAPQRTRQRHALKLRCKAASLDRLNVAVHPRL
jgi:hypothetical protein